MIFLPARCFTGGVHSAVPAQLTARGADVRALKGIHKVGILRIHRFKVVHHPAAAVHHHDVRAVFLIHLLGFPADILGGGRARAEKQTGGRGAVLRGQIGDFPGLLGQVLQPGVNLLVAQRHPAHAGQPHRDQQNHAHCQAIKLEAVTTIKWYKGNTGLYYLGLIDMHNSWITMCTFNQEAKCKQIYNKIIKILRKGNSDESD